ncbi:HD domain-containing protein [Mycolicibacterium komossense]|uniref:HD family phosphohydrolase n=1 Tax=Mycolicibacterium komossense TaxID=1779 RepID=A0ABT3C876_9MYCO|nr:HD family phosphohydrolase [Mycolicibacterium komossense]MCV7225670.1 HD family phosphohydrolase [Mycolicibacterium komossense]
MTSVVDQTLTGTAEVLRSLRGIWDEEAVDELDHALQSAARAIEDGADDELVLAAALHDLGHSPLFDDHAYTHHDMAARTWLTPRFGERVGWLAGAHVAAKRYLAATQPDYCDGLSGTSVVSLQAQGGAGVDADFVDHPWWVDAVRLRRYDDGAKDPAAQGATIEDVLAIAERVIRQQENR